MRDGRTEGRTDGRTDRRTDGRSETSIPPQQLCCAGGIIKYMARIWKQNFLIPILYMTTFMPEAGISNFEQNEILVSGHLGI